MYTITDSFFNYHLKPETKKQKKMTVKRLFSHKNYSNKLVNIFSKNSD